METREDGRSDICILRAKRPLWISSSTAGAYLSGSRTYRGSIFFNKHLTTVSSTNTWLQNWRVLLILKFYPCGPKPFRQVGWPSAKPSQVGFSFSPCHCCCASAWISGHYVISCDQIHHWKIHQTSSDHHGVYPGCPSLLPIPSFPLLPTSEEVVSIPPPIWSQSPCHWERHWLQWPNSWASSCCKWLFVSVKPLGIINTLGLSQAKPSNDYSSCLAIRITS